ncbi:Helicase [Georgfuchsia toluolica]|uniref:Helicase n=1 Tax=Georgfuchsia toluolica TaxID=424218 RepID=A0A916N9Y4_9PROT|nr:DEAD/DEAH box helicase [Georgfuchsia toluolica]CAG4884605.1 Helicase [Georgfuchsia toluolica]
MNPTDCFTVTDVANWLSSREVAKAQSYLDAVTDLDISDSQINAKVQGTAAKPYRVAVTLSPNGRNFPARIICTCPVGGYCKHVAAALLKTIEVRDRVDRVTPAALEWIEALRQMATGPGSAVTKPKQQLFWLIAYADDLREFRVGCLKGRIDGNGMLIGKPAPWYNFEQALSRPFSFIDDDDVGILRLLLAQNRSRVPYRGDLSIMGRHGADILSRMVETGRLYANGFAMRPLRPGPARPASIFWRHDALGRFCAQAKAEPAASWALPLNPPWYVDGERHEVGELVFDSPSAVIARILAAPPLNEAEARLATDVLAATAPGVSPPVMEAARTIDVAPIPQLKLNTLEASTLHMLRQYPAHAWGMALDVAQVGFRYEETVFDANDKHEIVVLASGEPVHIKRQPGAEAQWLAQLKALGFESIPKNAVSIFPPQDVSAFMVLQNEAAWPAFMSETLPRLRAEGWEIAMPEYFRHHFLNVAAWEAEITETESGWFDIDMGIVVEDRRLSLAPLLAELFRNDPRWLDAKQLEKISGSDAVELFTPQGQRIRVKAERIKPLAQTLIDLFDGVTGKTPGPLRISQFDAQRLTALDAGWRVEGLEAIQRMMQKIAGLDSVKAIAAPAGFALTLRHYQLEGLAWLQYLREHDLAGILADDMGLGKTAQALAHLLLEKEAGRLDRPALIVLPTSLIFNWKLETARFAPGLSVLSLQGKARHERFADIAHHDLVLTTYPLLWRDAEELAKHEYAFLILDEAQTVKNASSQGAAVVRQIKARHRLCLTGTPLENHLGELWSQFDFLLPGFLGDAKAFTKTWRTPIEKQGNNLRGQLLAQRIRPFILRRRKEDVAKELPAKTIILRSVELQAGQRDLYETVRSAMDKQVRDAIAAKGFARSQIILLDALLKLRQVCCDPRLVKSGAAQKVKERAKLDQLMGMLPELVDEGRKVLVFSQFTTMLALIEDELKQAGLDYALLTGQTQDRETQIRRFQEGTVPVFLISLKAGGVGLNLTAADTVIHYDPWWNPAVENQATDRAHRLGQTKPVFVYKLIVAGSIEEKILALQERKAALADSVLSSDGAGEVKFSEADIQALLAPLPALK